MRTLCETLQSPELGGLDSKHTGGKITWMALIHAVRSAELMLLHSLLTLGEVQAPLTEVSNRAETSATRRRLRKDIVESETKRGDMGPEEQPQHYRRAIL